MDIGKIFEDVIKPIAENYNKDNPIKCRYEISDSKLWGLIFDKQLFEVSVNWIVSPGLDKPLVKKHPIGEDNQTEIIKGVRDLKFDNVFLELLAIKKDWIANGIKHTFRYKIVLDGVPQIELAESKVPNKVTLDAIKELEDENIELEIVESIEVMEKDFKKKIKGVKYGKS